VSRWRKTNVSASKPKLPTGQGQSLTDPGLPLDVLATNVQAKAHAASIKAKGAAWNLILKAADARDRMNDAEARILLEAAQDLLEEVGRWRDAWQTVSHDRDAAVDMSMQCSAHGEEIRRLRGAVYSAEMDRARVERAHRVLYAWYAECVKFVSKVRHRRGVSGLPASELIVSWMETQLPRVEAAHEAIVNPAPPVRREP
jgi:hypothetical protein